MTISYVSISVRTDNMEQWTEAASRVLRMAGELLEVNINQFEVASNAFPEFSDEAANFDERTRFKVEYALGLAGLSPEAVQDAVRNMEEQGILFMERP